MLSTQRVSRVRTRTQPDAGHRNSKKTKIEEPASNNAPDGFLNHLFMPLIPTGNPFVKQYEMERFFISSLKHFSDTYGINPCNFLQPHYPDNLRCAYNLLKDELKKLHPDLELLLLEMENNSACLATVKTYNTNSTLFYIPVEKLYLSMQSKKYKYRDELLISALSYLHLAGGIPFYTEPGSFIGGQYEMISDWTHNEPDDWEEAAYKSAISDLKRLSRAGEKMFGRIANPANLLGFESRISRYGTNRKHDSALLNTCYQLLLLYKEFGHRTIMDSVIPDLSNPSDTERVFAEQYISFCWSVDGWIWDHLLEMVNSWFQECASIEEPCSIRIFDGTNHIKEHDLRFEIKFFELLANIIDHLIELP